MAADELHKNDYGTIIRTTIKDGNDVVDISSYTTKEFNFKKPSGTISTKTASFTNSGSDGLLQYTVESGVLNECGYWNLQARLQKTGDQKYTDWYRFKVFDNLEAD